MSQQEQITNFGDDLYLRDGETYTNGEYYPEVPQEQVEQETRAKGIIASSYPIMNDVADWFDESIADSQNMSNIDLTKTEFETDKGKVNVGMNVSAEAQILAYQLLTQMLQDKKAEFQEFGKGRE